MSGPDALELDAAAGDAGALAAALRPLQVAPATGPLSRAPAGVFTAARLGIAAARAALTRAAAAAGGGVDCEEPPAAPPPGGGARPFGARATTLRALLSLPLPEFGADAHE